MLNSELCEAPGSVIHPDEDIFGGNKPLLALFDLDRGIDSAGNPSSGLTAIARLVEQARAIRLPIAYLFLERAKGGQAMQSLSAFRPQLSDMVFERALLSCFSSEYFSAIATRFSARGIVLSGCGPAAALATLFDAQRAGVRARVVVDRVCPIAEQLDAFNRDGILSLMEQAGVSLSGRTWPYGEYRAAREITL